MFKPKSFVSYLVLATLLLIVFTNNVSATVGGPTYVERVSYSASENALYFLINNQGGRGCPPIIHKIDLRTGVDTTVVSCSETEANYYRQEGRFDSVAYNQLIEDTFRSANLLPVINLAEHNISTEVEYVGEHRYDEYNVGVDFRARVSQGGENLGLINFSGCSQDQENNFRGYLIPGTDKLTLVVSRIGDCFEGGYTMENLYVLDRINAAATPVALPDSPEVNKTKFSLAWGLLVLVVGIGVGYIISRRTK